MEIVNIGVHHSGPIGSNPLSKSSSLTEEQINAAHKLRWPDFPSELNGSYIGYNAIYFPDGTRIQCRLIGEETAAQKGHNLDTFSGCMIGNFTRGVEIPTIFQRTKLRNDIKILLTNDWDMIEKAGFKIKQGTILNLTIEKIFPHRILQPNHTSCYGDGLSDSWAREIIGESIGEQEKVTAMKIVVSLCQQFISLFKQKHHLGKDAKSCFEADVRG